MNPYAEAEAKFAQAVTTLTSAAKKGADPVELDDFKAENKRLSEELEKTKVRLESRTARLSELSSKLEEQSEVINDVDAVIDGLRAQLGGN
ncbi:MAG: hypothetical protein AAFR98_13335 [Pseudomonadota bacterium]